MGVGQQGGWVVEPRKFPVDAMPFTDLINPFIHLFHCITIIHINTTTITFTLMH